MGRKVGAVEQRKALVDEHAKALQAFFARQAMTLKSFEPTDWNAELADVLSTLGTATAETVGQRVAKSLGGGYSLSELQDWLDANAKAAAGAINQATANQIQGVIDDAFAAGADPDAPADAETDPKAAVGHLFAVGIAARALQIADTRVTMVSGYSTVDAAKQNDAGSKTWTLGAGKPRSTHVDMDGETVALGEQFSNGMNYPGDYSGGADEVAGCTCTLQISKGQQ